MPNGTTSAWSKEMDAAILKMRSEKVTCIAMGKAVGRSGSAVAGRLQRLGVAKVREFLSPEERKRRRAACNLAYRQGIAPSQKLHRAVVVAELANVTPGHLSLIDLPANGCKWPYGDGPFTFCGCDREEGKPYCYAHQMQATEPVRRRMAA
jgi:hypothetical protein